MCGPAELATDFSEIKIAFRIPPEHPTPNSYAPSWNALTDTPPSITGEVFLGTGLAMAGNVLYCTVSAPQPPPFNRPVSPPVSPPGFAPAKSAR
jgi:hypothetical protein